MTRPIGNALWVALAFITTVGCTSGASSIGGSRPLERSEASRPPSKETNWRNVNEITSPKLLPKGKVENLAAEFGMPAKEFSNLIGQQLAQRGAHLVQSDRDSIEAAYNYLLESAGSVTSEGWENEITSSSGTLRRSRFGDLKGNGSQCAEIQHQHRFYRPANKTYRIAGTIKLCRDTDGHWAKDGVTWRRSGDDLS